MDIFWLWCVLAGITISAWLIGIIMLFNKKDEFNHKLSANRLKYKRKPFPFVVTCFSVYKNELLKIVISLLIAVTFIVCAVCIKPLIFDPDPTPVPTVTPVPTSTPIPTPISTEGLEQKYLSDLTPIITNEDAYFFNSSDSDGFGKIQIGEKEFDHGIVINASSNPGSEIRDTANEPIEFRLEKKFTYLKFQLGVDESSLCDFDRTGPACICRVVMDSVSSDAKNNNTAINVFDSDWFDYRKKSNYEADLSNVEILRITAYWVYDVSPVKDNNLKLAIVDPVLYLKESENKTGAPQDAGSNP